jgi:acyl dehydratase
MRTITGLDELKQATGEELGVSEWHEVTQKDIDAFAEATGDHQWIHVDPERAKDTRASRLPCPSTRRCACAPSWPSWRRSRAAPR